MYEDMYIYTYNSQVNALQAALSYVMCPPAKARPHSIIFQDTASTRNLSGPEAFCAWLTEPCSHPYFQISFWLWLVHKPPGSGREGTLSHYSKATEFVSQCRRETGGDFLGRSYLVLCQFRNLSDVGSKLRVPANTIW